MDDLDLDLDIEDDPIKTFLLHKLEELKLSNSELEQQLKNREEAIASCAAKIASEFGENILENDGVWQRILDGKWIIGIRVKMTNTVRPAKNINVVLNWNTLTPLVYRTKIYTRFKQPENERNLSEKLKVLVGFLETQSKSKNSFFENEWKSVDEISQDSSVIVAFEIPEFLDTLEYTMNGVISYECRRKQCQLVIPEIRIKEADTRDSSYVIEDHGILNGGDEEFLSSLIVKDRFELVARLPENLFRSLDKIMEFECMLKSIPVSSAKKYFYVHNISKLFNGTIVEVENEENRLCDLTAYCCNETQLQALLHFLHQNVPGIIILSRKLKESLVEEPPVQEASYTQPCILSQENVKSKFKEFGSSLESQLNLVEEFCSQRLDEISNEALKQTDSLDLDVNINDYKNFRLRLADLELKSDLLYGKVERFMKKPEATLDDDEEDDSDEDG